jgi:hypothetical protein
MRAVAVGLMIAAGTHLAFLAYRANFVYHADYRNPYVYAHPTEEIFVAVDTIKEYAATVGAGRSADRPVQVAVPNMDYWPLPWYFRDLPYVGYASSIPEQVGPLILISDKLEGALTQKLYFETPVEQRRMYMYLFDDPSYIWARPGVKLLGFVRKDLWDEHALAPVDPNALIEARRGEGTSAPADAVRP